ncbi:ROK family transcriptional regulator [Amaricoccus sp.]|uniref:ROK family transcriptional regulator n=1 Tax=Amaricoccus sp. TaxID=1872485 RepID=UPI001B5AE663|nr:ROK family transcriptional regulator [Amaricoccus sp.]MBP7003293.1 ROK family transcriptional regulator [Amaricoccus sp.]
MRAYNERLVLSLVRRHGALAKTEIARMTGLSAQTVSVIMRHLEADRLLRRGEPQRGRVGQPSVPLSLDPEGAFFVGAKVGRRSLELALVDFAGVVRWQARRGYRYPTPRETVRAIVEAVAEAEALLGPAAAARIAGIGLAAPFALWSWAEEMGAPEAEMAAWRDADLRADLAARLPYPVYFQNDATAACGAELAFGAGAELNDFLYLHVGAFIGGGLVLNGGLFAGRTGNAAAIGSMPVQDGGGRMVQLIEIASLVVLERRLRAAGVASDAAFDPSGDWTAFEPHLGRWIDEAAHGMAQAIAAASTVIDIEAALIDGALPPAVLARLIAATEAALAGIDLSGVEPPSLRAGALGPIARALGGASLPLFDRYLVERHALSGVSGRPQVGPG